MPGAASGEFAVKSCGKAHAWCATCRPDMAAAQRKPKKEPKQHELKCRSCGRCDVCLGLSAPEGMKVCRDCQATKPVEAFARRNDTGGRRNQCMRCRTGSQDWGHCEGCGKAFTKASAGRTHCAACRPPVTKPCATCGTSFVGSMEQRRYCSPACRDGSSKALRATARKSERQRALQAYGGPEPRCVCCGEQKPSFLALDHIDGGGHRQRKETGGGGFWIWLHRNNYPAGFRVLCHNCNFGRQLNGGICPHEQE